MNAACVRAGIADPCLAETSRTFRHRFFYLFAQRYLERARRRRFPKAWVLELFHDVYVKQPKPARIFVQGFAKRASRSFASGVNLFEKKGFAMRAAHRVTKPAMSWNGAVFQLKISLSRINKSWPLCRWLRDGVVGGLSGERANMGVCRTMADPPSLASAGMTCQSHTNNCRPCA